jgi:hypothetical protein
MILGNKLFRYIGWYHISVTLPMAEHLALPKIPFLTILYRGK